MSTYLPSVISMIPADAFIVRSIGCSLKPYRPLMQPIRWVPASNAWEDGNGFYVQMALLGWEPKDIILEVNNQVLIVKGERNVELKDSEKYYLCELPMGGSHGSSGYRPLSNTTRRAPRTSTAC